LVYPFVGSVLAFFVSLIGAIVCGFDDADSISIGDLPDRSYAARPGFVFRREISLGAAIFAVAYDEFLLVTSALDLVPRRDLRAAAGAITATADLITLQRCSLSASRARRTAEGQKLSRRECEDGGQHDAAKHVSKPNACLCHRFVSSYLRGYR
jgi:hypothetical protein